MSDTFSISVGPDALSIQRQLDAAGLRPASRFYEPHRYPDWWQSKANYINSLWIVGLLTWEESQNARERLVRMIEAGVEAKES